MSDASAKNVIKLEFGLVKKNSLWLIWATLRQSFIDNLGSHSQVTGKQDEETYIRISKAGAVMHALHRSVVMKRELSSKAKLVVFRSIFVPILTYGHEFRVMTKRMRSRVQASKWDFCVESKEYQRTLLDKVSRIAWGSASARWRTWWRILMCED